MCVCVCVLLSSPCLASWFVMCVSREKAGTRRKEAQAGTEVDNTFL